LSKVKGQGHQKQKNALTAADTPGSVRMVYAGCKQRAAEADDTILSLPGVISRGLGAVYVW